MDLSFTGRIASGTEGLVSFRMPGTRAPSRLAYGRVLVSPFPSVPCSSMNRYHPDSVQPTPRIVLESPSFPTTPRSFGFVSRTPPRLRLPFDRTSLPLLSPARARRGSTVHHPFRPRRARVGWSRDGGGQLGEGGGISCAASRPLPSFILRFRTLSYDMDATCASGTAPVRVARMGGRRKVLGRRARNAGVKVEATSVAPGSDIKTAARKRGACRRWSKTCGPERDRRTPSATRRTKNVETNPSDGRARRERHAERKKKETRENYPRIRERRRREEEKKAAIRMEEPPSCEHVASEK